MTFPDPSGMASAAPAPQESNVTNEPSQSVQGPQEQAASQALYELEKIGKFKFEGQEWTPEALKKAILREKDYTKKTQEIGEQRKSFETDEKFYKNLHWDLKAVSQNPKLINEFIRTYPAKFHSYLKEYLEASHEEQQALDKRSQNGQQSRPLPDVELLSRLERVEQSYAQQEIAKNEAQISSIMERMGKKYPDAMSEMVLAHALDVHGNGTPLDEQAWEQIYKQMDAKGKEFVKARYGDLVKQQKSANEKSRGVESGGGIVGQAPKKMSFKEATDAAIKGLTNR